MREISNHFPLCIHPADAAPPYAQTEWPALHHGPHNSDFVPVTVGEFVDVHKLVQTGWAAPEGTSEAGILLSQTTNGLTGLIFYLSQSSSMAQFMAINGKLPEGMKDLNIHHKKRCPQNVF